MNIANIKIPVINVKTNPLDALLAGLGLRFTQLAKTSDDFKKLLADRAFTIQIGSEASSQDGGIQRHYKVSHGSFSQHFGYATKPDLTMTFKDSATGVKILTKGDPTAFMVAVQAGELKMEGDYSLLMWFGKAAKLVVPQIPAEAKQYLGMAKQYGEMAYDSAKPYVGMAMPYVKQALNTIKGFKR